MSWLFGKSSSGTSSSPLSSSTPLQQQRLKQIKSLHTYNQNVVEVKREHEYNVMFNVTGKTITLNIILPAMFPNEKPVVYVSAPYFKHPWVDSNMIVTGSEGLNTFYMHSDLGKVIQRITKEFKKNPPQFIARDFNLPPVPTGFPTSYNGENNNSNTPVAPLVDTSEENASPLTNHRILQVQQKVNHEPDGRQEIENIMDKLDQLQMEELERYCNNPDSLWDYISDMESIKKLQEQRIKMVEDNERISKETLELEPLIEDLKGDLKETFETYNDLYHGFLEKSRQQDDLMQVYNVGNMSTNLRISVFQAEEESDKIAEHFLDGGMNVDQFLTSFLDKRKLYYTRHAKSEKIKTLT